MSGFLTRVSRGPVGAALALLAAAALLLFTASRSSPADVPTTIDRSAQAGEPLGPPTSATEAGTATTYPGFHYGASIDAPTKNKPQSKLWYAADAWWALMVNPAVRKVHVFELMDNHSWRDTGVAVDDRQSSTADVLWDGQVVHIASRASNGEVRFLRLDYAPTTRSFQVQPGFPVAISSGGANSVAVTLDSAQRPWVTFVQDGLVRVAHATGPDARVWTVPFTLPVPEHQATNDDIASIGALPGRIGVLWSNQRTGAFYFIQHEDGAPDAEWGPLETPVQGELMADGHVNLATRPDGTAYAAVKTALDDEEVPVPSDPQILVLERSADGTWQQHVAGTVGDQMTRPALIEATSSGLFYLFYASPAGGGRIFYKISSIEDMRWGPGPGIPVMAHEGASLNNVTTAKAPVDEASGIVLLASDSDAHRYYHAEIPVEAAP